MLVIEEPQNQSYVWVVNPEINSSSDVSDVCYDELTGLTQVKPKIIPEQVCDRWCCFHICVYVTGCVCNDEWLTVIF